MEKETYVTPKVEIYEVAVEHGFASSGEDGTTESFFEDPTESW